MSSSAPTLSPARSFNVQRSAFNVRRSPTSLLPLLALFLLSLTPRLAAQDTLILKNGRKADCRVLDFTAGAVKISFRATPDTPPADRLIPLADIDYVELAPLPGESEALAQAVREGRSEPLMTFWVKRLPWLNRPRTNGGEIGLTYAELLTRVATTDRMERALKIYEQISAADWSAERRGRAQAGKLRVMLRQGRTAEVLPLAESLLKESGDPRVLIELRHVMAEAAAASLAQLEKDHPRWHEEDDLVPRHTQLLHDAFDGYLYPHLFHGAEEDLAARGLWAAAQLSAAQNLTTQAADWSTDLIHLYANQPEAAAARTWLEKQPAKVIVAAPQAPPAGDPDEEDADPEEVEEAAAAEEAAEPAKAKSRSKPAPKAKTKAKSEAKAKPAKEAADD